MYRFNTELTFILFNVFLCAAVSPPFKGVVPCLDSDDCKYFINGTCIGTTCMCNGTTMCTEKASSIVSRLGETCNTTAKDCKIDHSFCQNNTCVCDTGYVKSTNGRKCLKVSEGVGGSCEDSVQCYTKTSHGVCRTNKCVCEEMQEVNGICFKNVELGGTCQENIECSLNKFSLCKNSTCTCKEGYVAGMNKTVCLKISEGDNAPCIDHLECTEILGEHSCCVEGFCRCKELYHFNKKLNKCVFDRLYGETCRIHNDCHDVYPEKESRLECVYGECKCRYFLRYVNGVCVDKSGVSSTMVANIYLLVLTYLLCYN